jgi:hypothetical protein
MLFYDCFYTGKAQAPLYILSLVGADELFQISGIMQVLSYQSTKRL